MKLIQAIDLRIKELCKEKDMTRCKMSSLGGFSRQTISSLKKKETVMVSTIWNICDTLGITISEFFNSPLFLKSNIDD